MPSVEIEQLQEAMELGAVRERNRIIELLNHEYWHNTSHLSGIHYDCLMCEAIALIKGEN